MTDILSKITAYKREEIARAKQECPPSEIEALASSATPVRPFADTLSSTIAAGRPALVAEIKKASPSKGLIRSDFDPPALAQAYEAGGAACLSVLTDAPSFQGAPTYLSEARAACNLPVLRKDFMIDLYQVPEARAWGADCILIILAQIEDGLASELAAAARQWGMDAIAEVHDETELDRAAGLDCRLIGINNRNLKTFETTLETSERLVRHLPDGRLGISESGISTNADIRRLQKAGSNAFLVGESLMRHQDVAAATRMLLTGEAA